MKFFCQELFCNSFFALFAFVVLSPLSVQAVPQFPACMDVMNDEVFLCLPRDARYNLTNYSNRPGICAYYPLDASLTLSTNKIKEGHLFTITWSPQSDGQGGVTLPAWINPNDAFNTVVQGAHPLDGSCYSQLPSDWLPQGEVYMQPSPGATCADNSCSFILAPQFYSTLPGWYLLTVDYYTTVAGYSGRMDIPVQVVLNEKPEAHITFSQISPLKYSVSGLTSTDDSEVTSYYWSSSVLPGNDPRREQSHFEVEFSAPGDYAFSLTVGDEEDTFGDDDQVLHVGTGGGNPSGDPASVVRDISSQISSSLKSFKATFKKNQAAQQKALKTTLKDLSKALATFVANNSGGIETSASSVNLSKLANSVKSAVGKVVKRLESFSDDKKSANKSISSLLKGLKQ